MPTLSTHGRQSLWSSCSHFKDEENRIEMKWSASPKAASWGSTANSPPPYLTEEDKSTITRKSQNQVPSASSLVSSAVYGLNSRANRQHRNRTAPPQSTASTDPAFLSHELTRGMSHCEAGTLLQGHSQLCQTRKQSSFCLFANPFIAELNVQILP